MTRVQTVLFSLLHILAVLCLPLLITLLGGCLETEKLQIPAAVPCEEVETALNDALTPNLNFNINDFAHTQTTIAPLTNNPQVVADIVEQLVNLIPHDGGIFETRTLRTTITYSPDGKQKTETKEAMAIAPDPYRLCPSPDAVTYHGLQIFRRKARVTDYNQNCGAYPNCEVNVVEIKFDQVIRWEDGSQDANKYTFITSVDVPYVARVLHVCATTAIAAGGQKIPVTQCSTVKNFGNASR